MSLFMSILAYFRPDPEVGSFVLKYRRLLGLTIIAVVMSSCVYVAFCLISLSSPVTPEALKAFVAEQTCHGKEVRRILDGSVQVVTNMDLLTIASRCQRRERESSLVKAQKGALNER
jgi:hypothetical protein